MNKRVHLPPGNSYSLKVSLDTLANGIVVVTLNHIVVTATIQDVEYLVQLDVSVESSSLGFISFVFLIHSCGNVISKVSNERKRVISQGNRPGDFLRMMSNTFFTSLTGIVGLNVSSSKKSKSNIWSDL